MKAQIIVHTKEEILNKLHYDAISGIWTWINPRDKKYLNNIAGSLTKQGYLQINLWKDSVRYRYYLHRLAYFVAIGEQPIEINHKNGIRYDNKLSNLEASNRKHNMRRKTKIQGEIPHMGIYMNHKLYEACIIDPSTDKRVRKTFKLLDDAINWRKNKEKEFGYAK